MYEFVTVTHDARSSFLLYLLLYIIVLFHISNEKKYGRILKKLENLENHKIGK